MRRGVGGGIVAVLACAACGSAPVRPTAEPVDAIHRGDALYAQSEYAEAAASYEAHLAAHPDDPRNDAALLRLALIHLTLAGSDRDPERGERYLEDLGQRFPDSPLRAVADYMLDLLREVRTQRGEVERYRRAAERLESQLEALKRIDLERGDSLP